jgi:hypothetical protein
VTRPPGGKRWTRPRLAAALVVAGVLAAVPTAGRGLQDGPALPELHGKLYRAVFFSSADVLGPADLQAVPEPLRTRLATFLARRAAFKSGYRGNPENVQQARADAKRRALERAIVSLVETAGVQQAAAEFVAAAPIAHEWEGLHHGPLAEATYAEDVLKKDPASPLAPFLYVFTAVRQRIAFEAYENEKNGEGMRTAARKYRAFVERARAVADPIYPALVADMERQPFLYLKAATHPRDYDPDT